MSFRITAARLDALFARARANLAELTAPVAPPPPLSEAEQRIERACTFAKTHFAEGHRKGIMFVLCAALGIDDAVRDRLLTPSPASIPGVLTGLKAGTIVVLTGNPNSHDYPLNEPIILLQDDGTICLKFDGTELVTGNNAPINCPESRYRDVARLATPEEINAFEKKLRDRLARGELPEEDALLKKMGLVAKPAAP